MCIWFPWQAFNGSGGTNNLSNIIVDDELPLAAAKIGVSRDDNIIFALHDFTLGCVQQGK